MFILLPVVLLATAFSYVSFINDFNITFTMQEKLVIVKADTGVSLADETEKGGAVYVKEGAKYTMSGGSINSKKVKYGGAVFIEEGATFTMTGGTINSCGAKYGGAIYVSSGATCNIFGGVIKNCYAEQGVDIYVEEGGILNITNENESLKDNYFKLYDITINFYVDGIIEKSITRLADDGTLFNLAEAPLNYNQCPGYYTDENFCDSIERSEDFLTNEYLDTRTTGVVNLYTKTATINKLTFTSSGTRYIAGCDGNTVEDVVLPRTYLGNQVDIAQGSFMNAEMTSIFLHSKIEQIPNNAFNGASSLEIVNIPRGITSLGTDAFAGCGSLRFVEYAGTIDKWFDIAISNKTATPMYNATVFLARGEEILSVVVPEDITHLSYHLTGFIHLEQIDLSNVQTIGEYALYKTESLASISLASNITTISNNAFDGSGLRRVDIPSSVGSVGTNAFANCKYLSRISICKETSLSAEGILPEPSATYLENADGNWYNLSTASGYSPSNVPSGIDAVYVARKGRVTLASTSGTLIYPNQVSIEVTENLSGSSLMATSSKQNIASASISGMVLVVTSNTTEGISTITVTSPATDEYTSASATYQVAVQSGTLTVTALGHNGIYDGNDYGISVSCKEGGTITYSTDGGNTYSATIPTYKNAGTYTVYYKVEKLGYVTQVGSKEVVIRKATGSIKLSSYSGEISYPESTTITVTENISRGALSVNSSSVDIANVSLTNETIKINSNTTAGTATITVTSAETTNYTQATATYTVIVKKGTLKVTASGYSGTYDGANHSISVTSTPSATITYATSSNGTYSATNPSYKNAGTYTIYYKIEKAGYNTVQGNQTINISKASGKVTLSSTSGTIAYPNTTTTTVTENLSGGTLSVASNNTAVAKTSISGTTVTIEANTTAGSATITVTSAETTNYTQATATYIATVKNGTLSVSASGYTGTYDGSAHTISVTSTPSATITYATSSTGTYSATNPSYTNAGTYTTYYKVAKAGYTTVTGSKQVVINKAKGVITVHKTSVNMELTDVVKLPISITGDGTITATSGETARVTTSISGSVLTLNGVGGGSTTVTLSASGTNYQYDNVVISVVVKALTSIAVTKAPTDTIYYHSENFDAEGMQVTATYSDGSTKVLYDNYTMSLIPSGYTILEYLQSNGKQYIDTGVTIEANTRIEAEIMFNSAFNYNMMYGAWPILSLSMRESNYICVSGGGAQTQNIGLTATTGVKYNIKHDPTGISFNGTKANLGSGANSSGTGRNILMFAASDSSTGNTPYPWSSSYGVGRIYSFKIYNGNWIARDFIPVRNASGTLGMFDIVTQTFYPNKGTETFTAGGEIYSNTYTELEYIEATGTQYIKTGVIGGAEWELDIQFTNLNTRQLMGYGGSGAEYWGVQVDGNYGVATWAYMNVQGGERDTVIHTYGINSTHRLTVVGKGTMGLGVTDVSSKEYQLFAIGGEYLCKAKLYGCKAYDANGTLIRDFVPCKKANGVVGLYDKVNNVFYSNSGSGSFVAGVTKSAMGYTVTNGKNLIAGMTSVTISYTENGVTKTATQNISVNKIAIDVPTQKGTLTYNQKTQTPAWNNYSTTALTIGGTTSGTNAGSYNASFGLKTGFVWSDGSSSAKTVSWSIAKAPGSVVLSSTSGTIKYKGSITTSVSTNSSGGALSATSSNSNVASVSISGTTVTITSTNTVGTATITVTSAATANYNSASATYNLTVNKADGSITLSGTSGNASYADGGSFSVTGNLSGGSLSVSSSNNGIVGATISGNTITLKPGSITATNLLPQGGFEDLSKWNGAVADTSVKYQGNQSLKLTGTTVASTAISTPIVGHKYYGREYIKTSGANNPADCRFEIFGGDGVGLNWVFGYNNGNYGNWTMISGIVTIDCLNASSYVVRTFVVNSSNTTWIDGLMMIDLTALFGAGNEPSKEWCDENLTDFVNTGTVPAVGATATITVTSASTTNYNATSATYKVTVTKGTLVANVTNYTGTYDGNAYSATITNSQGGTVTYSKTNGSYTSTNPTFVNAGTHTTYYKISKYGCDSIYGTATVQINKVVSTLSLSATSGTVNYGYTASVTATTNAPTGLITSTSKDTVATASANGNIVTITPTGLLDSATITIGIAESTNYTAISKTYTVTVIVPIGAYISYSGGGHTDWRIMYNTSTAIQVISTGSVSGGLELRKDAGYEDCVGTMYTKAQEYLNGTYAVSARPLGYTSSSVHSVSASWDMVNDPYVDRNYEADVNHLIANSLVQTDGEVWLASRRIEGVSWGTKGQVRTLTTSGTVDYRTLQEYYLAGMQNDRDVTLGFRPIITLTSKLKFTGGNGTASSPYTFTVY